jgi:hypothetical protein
MAKRERNSAIPLSERHCTKCSNGIADGAVFRHKPTLGPNVYAPVCMECERTACRLRNRLRRGWTPERAGVVEGSSAQPVVTWTVDPEVIAGYEQQARLYTIYARYADDPIYRRRCQRAVRDYERLAQLAREGKVDGDGSTA